MVYFTCNNCGKAIKKNQVENHVKFTCYNSCVSCIDCGKDFWGSEYVSHTTCISEAEKYSGKNYVPKVNKGQQKQEEWVQCLSQFLKTANVSGEIRSCLEQIVMLPNVPKTESKFNNFAKHALKLKHPTITKLWDIIVKAKSNVKAPETAKSEKSTCLQNTEATDLTNHSENELKQNLNSTNSSDVTESSSKKKRKLSANGNPKTEQDEINEESVTNKRIKHDAGEPSKTFKWKKTVIGILKERNQHEISYKKLRRKVLTTYAALQNGKSFNEEEVDRILKEKINSSKKIILEENKVRLKM